MNVARSSLYTNMIEPSLSKSVQQYSTVIEVMFSTSVTLSSIRIEYAFKTKKRPVSHGGCELCCRRRVHLAKLIDISAQMGHGMKCLPVTHMHYG